MNEVPRFSVMGDMGTEKSPCLPFVEAQRGFSAQAAEDLTPRTKTRAPA